MKNIIVLLFCVAFLSLNAQTTPLVTGWYYISETPNEYARKLINTEEVVYIKQQPIVLVKDFLSVTLKKSDNNLYYLFIKFKPEYYSIWLTATSNSLGKKLAFIIDDTLVYTPSINGEIPNGWTTLNRDFSKKQLLKYKKIIEREMKW